MGVGSGQGVAGGQGGRDHSQQEYEASIGGSAASRAQKVKEIEELKDTRAAVSVSLVQSKEELASAVTCASETVKVTSALLQSCDWLLQNFDTRKTARAGEIEGRIAQVCQALLNGTTNKL